MKDLKTNRTNIILILLKECFSKFYLGNLDVGPPESLVHQVVLGLERKKVSGQLQNRLTHLLGECKDASVEAGNWDESSSGVGEIVHLKFTDSE